MTRVTFGIRFHIYQGVNRQIVVESMVDVRQCIRDAGITYHTAAVRGIQIDTTIHAKTENGQVMLRIASHFMQKYAAL